MTRRRRGTLVLLALLALLAGLAGLLVLAASRTASGKGGPPAPGAPPPCGAHPCFGAAATGWFAGATSQHRPLALAVGNRGSAVPELRFTIAYRCTAGARVLRVAVYRPLAAWEILDSGGRGFSDWFSGPIGHDFHVTGTFATDGRSLTGTLHSRLRSPIAGVCDSGRVTFTAAATGRPARVAAGHAITLRAFEAIRLGTPAGGVVARLGSPADREAFDPAGLVGDPYPRRGLLVYARRGHPGAQLSFVLRGGRVYQHDL